MNGEKLPPHDESAEEAVNGSLLIDGASIHKIADLLEPQDFYYEHNRLIYEACVSLYERNEAINQITVAQELDRRQKLDACGGVTYLSNLIATCPTSIDIEAYAEIVYRLSVMRHLISAAGQIAAIGYESDNDVDSSLNRAEEALFRLRHRQGSRDLVHIRQVLDRYFENVAPDLDTEAAVDRIPHILSGFHRLDEFLGGFQRSDLVIIAGRPSMGKTSFTLGIARNAAVNMGANVAIFSLEMATDSLVQRLLSSESDIESRRIRWGGIHNLGNERDEKRLMEAIGRLSESHIFIDDSPMLRIVELRSKARRLHFELGGLDLIVVDYLQLLQGDVRRTENRVQEISYISRSLKALARELNVPVFAVSQLSRAVEWRASHRPQLSDLRESGSIEQDADQVLFIYRDDYYYTTREAWEKDHPDQEYPQGIANIITAKHRNGPTGETDLHFSPKTAKFEDIGIASEELSLL